MPPFLFCKAKPECKDVKFCVSTTDNGKTRINTRHCESNEVA